MSAYACAGCGHPWHEYECGACGCNPRPRVITPADVAHVTVTAIESVATVKDAEIERLRAELARVMNKRDGEGDLLRDVVNALVLERDAAREELARVTREQDEALRRALGHAYTAQMAEGGESIVQQENDRLHREAREALASFRDLHVAAVEMVRCLMPTVRGEATEQELNATWNALKQLVAVLEKVSS